MAEKSDTDFTYLDQKLYALAAMVDTTIRFHVNNMDFDEMEKDYLSIWLKKERDPLLVTVIATMTGDRNLAPPQEGESTEDAAVPAGSEMAAAE